MVAGKDRHGDRIAGHRRCVNPRQFFCNGEVIDQVPGFEIVSAVEDEINVTEQLFHICGREIGRMRHYHDL